MNSRLENIKKIEFYTICCLAFSLPLFETAKHLFCLIYLLLFITRSFIDKENFTHHTAGKYFIAMVAGSSLSAIGAAYNGYEIHKLHDIIRYTLIGWMLLHTPLSTKQTYTIFATLLLSTLIAIIEAYFMLTDGIPTSFELRSVGHINHSAIYILHIVGISVPLLMSSEKNKILLITLLVTSALIYTLINTNSRATFLTLAILLLALTFICMLKKNKMGYFLSTAIVLASAYIIYDPPPVVKKFIFMNKTYAGELQPRERLWNTAFYVWKKEPVFGIGYGNYRIITPEKMQSWYPEINMTDESRFWYLSHTHNRYLNTLTEGGIIGFLALLIFMLGILLSLIKHAKQSLRESASTTFWLIFFNTFTIIFFTGLFNTTLHHEHGMLAMMLIGLSLYQLNQKNTETKA